MKMIELGCFRCNTGANRPAEVPWDWSSPRALCPSHKVALELEDGQLLDTVLDRVTPPDHPLEGSLFAWIFNPVYLNVGPDQRTKGWADFAAGGMAVFEDRFLAKGYFEFRAFEVARAVDLLYAVRLAAAAGPSMVTVRELMAAIVAAETNTPRGAQGPLRGPIEGLRDLIQVWNFQYQLDRVRSSLGRLWPESFVELNNWIEECSLAYEELDPGTDKSFVRGLTELAFRRFPAISP